MTNPIKKCCFIGIGSNINDPVSQVKNAIKELHQLPETRFIQISSLYQTAPIGLINQPDFVNAVAEIITTLSPHNLLQELQKIEQAHGRIRKIHWGPRTLDLDLLLYGNEIIDTAELTIPHPELYFRAFALQPLAEIAPDLVFPNGRAIADYVKLNPYENHCNLSRHV